MPPVCQVGTTYPGKIFYFEANPHFPLFRAYEGNKKAHTPHYKMYMLLVAGFAGFILA